MKIVVDSNVLLSGFFFGGVPGQILRAWQAGQVRFVFSPSILAEYREAGRDLESRYGGAEFESFITLLVVSSDLIDAAPSLNPSVCNDPDDDKFLNCAAVAGVGIIVSGDRALLAVSGWSGIEVVKPRTFADRYL